ncbi:tubby C-terminal-like domain-containing protein [Aspergillus bertholletiae]|uniref:Tubby C-terminal-like domain-containing protein n=1 Tax=Aspergillus bertholletiae TaxID=1226010 RepID=A0A5N7BHS4_9EURO|nr:tubby C-terminal-like domain-containing protein [Aspergillus bertholletiae]
MSPAQLPPVPVPVAILDQFIARQTETLVLKEKVLSLTGDSFDVKLANGQPIFQIKGKLLTIAGRKSVFDMAGRHLFDLVKEHLRIHTTYAAHAPDGRKLLEVKSSLALVGSRTTATFTSPRTGATVSLKMRGNWRDSRADIVDEATGMVLAQIDRKLLRARQLFFDQQTYAVVVAPGVDLALITALCVCFDEKNNEA